MDKWKLLPTTSETRDLCSRHRERELIRFDGAIREYKLGKEEKKLLLSTEKTTTPILQKAASLNQKSLSEPRAYGLTELGTGFTDGCMDSPDNTVTIYVPMALRSSALTDPTSPKHQSDEQENSESETVKFQFDVDSDTQTELDLPWQHGAPVQILGPCRIVVTKPIRFLMLQYDLGT